MYMIVLWLFLDLLLSKTVYVVLTVLQMTSNSEINMVRFDCSAFFSVSKLMNLAAHSVLIWYFTDMLEHIYHFS